MTNVEIMLITAGITPMPVSETPAPLELRGPRGRELRTCGRCQTVFAPLSSNAKYCTQVCADFTHNARKAKNRLEKLEARVIPFGGVECS